MRESALERRLHLGVVRGHGSSYKWTSPGRPGVPDRIVLWPSICNSCGAGAIVHLIEMKSPTGRTRPGQEREHVRLMKLGATVLILNTVEKVDAYLAKWTQ